MLRARIFKVYFFGILTWIILAVLSLKYGVIADADTEVIIELRLPRILLATAVGAGLSVAGAVLQALFSNPLSEPYTLGISSGAAVGAVFGTTLGLEWVVAGLAGTAFCGALVFTLLLYLVSIRPGITAVTFLLAGVMLSFFGSSLVALWMALSDSNGIQGAMQWLLGDLSRARLSGAWFLFSGVFILSFILLSRWRELDALLIGEEAAITMGVPVPTVRRRLILLVSLLVGLCVSAAGMIGFVGLVVPHAVRRFVGSLHLRLLPLAGLWGAVAVTAADFVSRMFTQPYELPVGVVTALLGAPVFLWIILSRQKVA